MLEIQTSPAPLVIYDWMVHAHIVYDFMKDFKELLPQETYRTHVKAVWAYSLNRGPEFLPEAPWRTIIVNDSKDSEGVYWRKYAGQSDPDLNKAWEKYSQESLNTTYKGNRGKRTEEFWEVERIGRDYAQEYFPFFSEELFEADDWAGTAARLHSEDRQMFLSTVDRDWSMLVDNDRGIYFANARRCKENERIQQRLVDNEGVIHHTQLRLNVSINHPRELAFAKSLMGDMGDNLPPGSPLYLFDLIEPPAQWKLENKSPDKVELLKQELYNPNPNTRFDHLAEVREKLPLLVHRVKI